tara:strand:- start:36 stop:353 length:318 start_codon:yes stop_codon:yes gene_type:complete
MVEDFITPIREELEYEMHEYCSNFLKEHSECFPSCLWLSPRYFNFGDFDYESKILRIQSTQYDSPNMGFDIQTGFDEIMSEDFWPQFKRWRTRFLEKYYPRIRTY